jgi:two-component system CheB/CheR fusion protein
MGPEATPGQTHPESGPGARRQVFPIAGVGASAGGLKAFQELLEHLPADPGLAFVLVPHLAPAHESMMSSILQRSSKMPIREVTEGTLVEPDHVYVIPPDSTLALSEGILHTIKPRLAVSVHEPIDHFFVSLAEEAHEKAIGIVLSGTASDGATGVKAIKSEGGIIFAQDQSAEFSGMPQAAIATGSVDFVLPPKGIAQELLRIARHPYLARPHDDIPPGERPDELVKVFGLLQTATGIEFAHYKPTTVKRRIARRMAVQKIDRLEDYRRHLEDNPQEVRTLHDDILVNVTSFFRDPGSFQALKEHVFPAFLEDRPPRAPIRIWVPGCATGEEPYSLAIALLEFLEEKGSQASAQIFASDVNESALGRARAGLYDPSIAQDVSPERLRRFFVPAEGGRYQISKRVRDLVLFAKQDLTRDPPFSRLDLLSCRNVLIYLGPVLQKRVIPLFHHALRLDGFLILGTSETVDRFPELFSPIDRKFKIYSKVPTSTGDPVFSYPSDRARLLEEARGAGTGGSRPQAFDPARELDRLLLRDCIPGVALVTEDGHVLEIRGEIAPFLRPAPGKPAYTLLKMFQQDLVPELETAMREVRDKGVRVRRERIELRAGTRLREVTIEARPLDGPGPRDRYFVLLFHESTEPGGPEEAPRHDPESRLEPDSLKRENERLRQALASHREYQQSIIEKIETSNEELRSSHEEVLSFNEELQSTNEELETAKEELQSTNEELTTLNEELRLRNEELGHVNSDLANVLSSVQIPIAIVDGALRLRRVTPAGEALLNLLPTDINRRITDFKPNVEIHDLDRMVTEAIDSLSTLEQEVRDREGRWYSLRVRPYRSIDNKIEGAVLTLIDIDAVKRIALENEQARAFSEAVFDSVPEALLVLDRDLRVRRANEEFFSLFGVGREETEKRLVYELGGGQWNIARLRTLLEDILPKNSRLVDFEVEYNFPGVGPKTILLHARKLLFWHTQEPMIVLALEDASISRNAEREVRHLASTLENRVRERTTELESSRGEMEAFTYSVAHDLRSPLRAMHQFAQVLLEDYVGRPLDEPGQDNLRRIIKASEKMDTLIQDLLAYSRLTRDGVPLEPLDLGPLLESLLQELDFEIRDRRAEVVVQGPLPRVRANRATLSQVLTNLLTNAVKFVPRGTLPRVQLRAERLDGQVRLWIEDNGLGIDPAHHQRIFRVFERLNREGEYPGTGIGLAIVRKGMERMGGRVGLESQKGQGSRFWIELAAEKE